jgi:hypothetical protein
MVCSAGNITTTDRRHTERVGCSERPQLRILRYNYVPAEVQKRVWVSGTFQPRYVLEEADVRSSVPG